MKIGFVINAFITQIKNTSSYTALIDGDLRNALMCSIFNGICFVNLKLTFSAARYADLSRTKDYCQLGW